jgi:hypothetical protein
MGRTFLFDLGVFLVVAVMMAVMMVGMNDATTGSQTSN